MVRVRVRFGVAALLAALGSGIATPAGAVPRIETNVRAEAWESGEDPGNEVDEDSTEAPGDTIEANAFRCLGDAICAFLPGDVHGGFARARTDYGVNRAYARAPEGENEFAENDVIDSAYASSFWADEWTFDVALPALGAPVSLAFQIDGSWSDTAAMFGAGIFDADEFYVPNPDDPLPFLDVDAQMIASIELQTFEENAVVFQPTAGNFLQLIPLDDGGEASGSVDLEIVVQFIPIPGHTYIVAARMLAVAGGGGPGGQVADFESTSELIRVVVPEGVSFTSAAGAQWNVVVPEVGAAWLVGLAAVAVAGARRRGLHGG